MQEICDAKGDQNRLFHLGFFQQETIWVNQSWMLIYSDIYLFSTIFVTSSLLFWVMNSLWLVFPVLLFNWPSLHPGSCSSLITAFISSFTNFSLSSFLSLSMTKTKPSAEERHRTTTNYIHKDLLRLYLYMHTYIHSKPPYNLSPNYKIPQSRAYDFLLQQSCCNAF